MAPNRRLLPATNLLVLLAALFAAPLDGCAASAQEPDSESVRSPGRTTQILVISGTDPYLPAFVAVDGSMRAAMAQRSATPTAWLYETSDAARLGGAPGRALAELLRNKYLDTQIDAVVLATEPAVDFYLRFRADLWPEVPVVVHSVSAAFARGLPAQPGLTVLPAPVDFAGTLRIARRLQPDARRVLLVGGASDFDETLLTDALDSLKSIAEAPTVEVVAGPSPQAIAARLTREAPDTIVLFSTLFRDADGGVHVPRFVLETISATSAAPIYGVYESYLGHGLAAGAIESLDERGERVAEGLLAALGQRAVSSREEAPRQARCIADGRELERHGLRARLLPDGCEVRFVEPSFLSTYWWQTLLVATALAGQAFLIASLLLQRRRRRAAELNLAAQRSQLLHASRLAVAGELTASIAHEINQPLGAILSNVEAAEMGVKSGRLAQPELLQILADIRRDDLRASEVIKRLRTLLARQPVERRRVDLNRLLDETAAILRLEVQRRGAIVEVVHDARRAQVVGDPVQIQQVVISLVLNALDACTDTRKGACRVVVGTADAPAAVLLSVRDFGAGIAPPALAQLFDSFFTTKQGGMGLGLSIARSIVEAHGGTIAAARREPGAEFTVSLPRAPAGDRPEAPATDPP